MEFKSCFSLPNLKCLYSAKAVPSSWSHRSTLMVHFLVLVREKSFFRPSQWSSDGINRAQAQDLGICDFFCLELLSEYWVVSLSHCCRMQAFRSPAESGKNSGTAESLGLLLSHTMLSSKSSWHHRLICIHFCVVENVHITLRVYINLVLKLLFVSHSRGEHVAKGTFLELRSAMKWGDSQQAPAGATSSSLGQSCSETPL